MPSISHASKIYQEIGLHSQIEGASQHKLIDLLFDGALIKLAKAKGYIVQNNIALKGQEIGKVIAIVTELQSSLLPTDNNEISTNLKVLYNYIIELIVEANISNKTESIDEAKQLLEHLRESWNLIPNESRF